MSPTIITDSLTGKVRLVIGGAGGYRIITAVAFTILLHIYYGLDIATSIDSPRIHHQLFPDSVIVESAFPEEVLRVLHDKYGHEIDGTSYEIEGTIINGISVNERGEKYAYPDIRRNE